MKLSTEEEYFFQMLKATSTKDESTVRDVLKSILISILINVYDQLSQDKKENKDSNTIEFSIPYVCKLRIDYKDHIVNKGKAVNVNLSALPSVSLIKEIENIMDDKDLDLINYIKKNISMKIDSIVEVDPKEDSCLG
jgi:hypothetical protein